MNKNLLSICVLGAAITGLGASGAAYADGHESEDLGHALFSIYQYIPGTPPADLEKAMVAYQKNQEAQGFDDCGLYRHEFGDTRGVYTYCFFKDMVQFGKIVDADPTAADTEPQLFADHTDHIVTVMERNMEKAPPYLVFSHFSFSGEISMAQGHHYTVKIFEVYDEAFGGCNAYEHKWGPELGAYFSCGFDNYADLAEKDAKLMQTLEEELMAEPMFIVEHSDDILKLVMD